MARPLPERTGASPGASPETFEGRSFANYRLFYQQGVNFQIGVVFRIRNGTFQSLAHHHRRLLRAKRQEIERIRGGTALDFSSHFPRLEGGDSSVAVGGCYLHFVSPNYFATFAVCAPCFLN